ncbi:MAG: extracellular solute-binding protein, partial [Firmicutes bacterium]|nr:extracellular solute-binding protein [Bacillota bacterium]
LKQSPPDAASWEWLGHREAYQAKKADMTISWGRILNRIGIEDPKLAAVTGVYIPPYDEIKVSGAIGDYYIIPKTVENPKETKDFLKWLITGEPMLRYIGAVPGHDLPPIKSVADQLIPWLLDNPNVYPEQTKYVREHSDWVKTFFNEIAPLGVDPKLQLGAVYNGTVDRSWFATDPDIVVRLSAAPTLIGEMVHKMAYEGWTAKQATEWGQKELEAVIKKKAKR